MRSRSKNTPFLVGICGGSGSGKSYLMQLLEQTLGDKACFLSQDHYYRALELQEKDEQGQVNFDLPHAIDQHRFIRDLDQLSTGKAIHLQEYTFNNPARTPRPLRIKPAPIIVVEGLFIFHSAAVRERLDLKVFIESQEAIALARRLQRDVQERAYSEEMIRYQWEHHVRPAYERYLLPYRKMADLIISNPADGRPDIRKLIELILNQSK